MDGKFSFDVASIRDGSRADGGSGRDRNPVNSQVNLGFGCLPAEP